MRDLSLHILDLAQNAIAAGAKLVTVTVSLEGETLYFALEDDGCGMDETTVQRVQSPFYTTRTTRRVGLGIPFLKENAEATGGTCTVSSVKGEGTRIEARFCVSHIDCIPLGDLCHTLYALLFSNAQTMDFVFRLQSVKGESCLDTREIKQVLAPVSIADADVQAWLNQTVREDVNCIFGGMLQ